MIYDQSDIRILNQRLDPMYFEGKQAKGIVSWLLLAFSNSELSSLEIHFDYPRTNNDIVTTLGQLRENPEIGSSTLKTGAPEIRLSKTIHEVRSFKNRKKFISSLETTMFDLVSELKQAKLI